MSKKKGYTQLEIDVSTKYNKREREAIAQDIVDFIVNRTLEGKKSGGGRFASYSKKYKESDDFKAAGKSKSKVNLKLSFDMLSEMEVVKTSKGKITVGYKPDNPEEQKAEGNIRGTYGQKSPIAGKARDFLLLNGIESRKVLRNYPLRGKDGFSAELLREERVEIVDKLDEQAETFLERIQLWEDGFGD